MSNILVLAALAPVVVPVLDYTVMRWAHSSALIFNTLSHRAGQFRHQKIPKHR